LAREAGFAPFDQDAMPAGLRLEDVVTAEGFARDPERARGYYNQRRRQLMQTNPSAAHDGLAVLDLARPGELLIVSGTIDDLHERAGSRAVIHLHGELMKVRCMICGQTSERYDDITAESDCPICANVGRLRPDVVWVGEELPHLASVYGALADAALFVAIGVALGSDLTQSLLAEARRAGAGTVAFTGEIADDAAPGAERFDERIPGPFAQTVPDYVERLIATG
jgi:NAD-dependent protein deacetylase/lipoamidase